MSLEFGGGINQADTFTCLVSRRLIFPFKFMTFLFYSVCNVKSFSNILTLIPSISTRSIISILCTLCICNKNPLDLVFVGLVSLFGI